MENKVEKREPLFRIVKKENTSFKKAVWVRAIAILAALLVCGIVSAILAEGRFFEFFAQLFVGVFGTPRRIMNLLQNTAMLLGVALAVTPAFRMKFWNIGAEGQVLMGALACAACMFYFGGKVPNAVLILIMLLFSVVMGAIWALIPAIFKAQWNTNETLFTLMMNYVAMQLISYFIFIWVPSGSATLGILEFGHLPAIFGQQYLLNILIVAVVTAVLTIYMRRSKHGYEISVVGESINTARYIGIDVKKVIIRTMLLSGAICGLVGFLLVGGTSFTVNTGLADGRGFTAILVSWLAQFNTIYMIPVSLLVVFLDQGAAQASTVFRLGGAFPDIIVGIFFFFIIGCEFFLRYQVKFRTASKEGK